MTKNKTATPAPLTFTDADWGITRLTCRALRDESGALLLAFKQDVTKAEVLRHLRQNVFPYTTKRSFTCRVEELLLDAENGTFIGE